MKLYINKLTVLQWKVQINILVYGKMKKGKMNKDFIVLKYFRKGEQIDCYWNDGDPNFQLFRTWWMLYTFVIQCTENSALVEWPKEITFLASAQNLNFLNNTV